MPKKKKIKEGKNNKVKNKYIDALDWMSLAKDVFPDSRPMIPEERESINEFFWSHFKKKKNEK